MAKLQNEVTINGDEITICDTYNISQLLERGIDEETAREKFENMERYHYNHIFDPIQAIVDEVQREDHELYVSTLEDLYETNPELFYKNEKGKLVMKG